MYSFLSMQKKIAPELNGLVELRYGLLRQIMLGQPLGRRVLALKTGMSERVLRSQVDFLKNAGLIDFSHFGMTVTADGRCLLDSLSEYVKNVEGIAALEKSLAQELALDEVVIVAGDSDSEEAAFFDLGNAAAAALEKYILTVDTTLAISGGSTMLKLSESVGYKSPTTLVVPARGGLGDNASQQANTIAALLAGRLAGCYRQLYIPDGVREETLAVLLAEDVLLRQVVDLMRHADIMLHGIGRAFNMAERRGALPEVLAELAAAGAVGEALGKYFSLSGEEIVLNKNAAVLLEDFSGIGRVMAVAGGKSKARAILAVCRSGNVNILVTDWAAAAAMAEVLSV